MKFILGEYYHIVGSLHLYSRNFNLAQMIGEYPFSIDFEMPPITDLSSIPIFLESEQLFAAGKSEAE